MLSWGRGSCPCPFSAQNSPRAAHGPESEAQDFRSSKAMPDLLPTLSASLTSLPTFSPSALCSGLLQHMFSTPGSLHMPLPYLELSFWGDFILPLVFNSNVTPFEKPSLII